MNTISEYHQCCSVRSIFCLLFIIKSMVLLPGIFLNNQFFCLYKQDRQTEKRTELA